MNEFTHDSEMQDDVICDIKRLLLMIAMSGRNQMHHHQCPKCRHIWAHRQADLNTHEEFETAHSCSECGTKEVYDKYEAICLDKLRKVKTTGISSTP